MARGSGGAPGVGIVWGSKLTELGSSGPKTMGTRSKPSTHSPSY